MDILQKQWRWLLLGYLAIGLVLGMIAKPPVHSTVLEMGGTIGVIEAWLAWTVAWPGLLAMFLFGAIAARVLGIQS